MTHFTSTLENFNSNLWHYHVPVPDEIADKYIEGDNKRIKCSLNGLPPFHAALMKSKLGWYVLVNKSLRTKLRLNTGAEISVTIEKDTSEYGHEMPEEFEAVLEQDEEGFQHFQALTKGKQRSLIYLVSNVKNSNSRINKSLAIVEQLKDEKGTLDFKKLNEKIKHYNNLSKQGF